MTQKEKALKKISDQIKSAKCCGKIINWTNAVPGEGNPDADIVFVGEAPGKEEDLKGRPFVGRAGRLLDEFIESIGLKREDVYITNIVKYRPPNNRDPLPEEVEECAKYLREQLKITDPKLIATLGRHAMYFFLSQKESISKAHGRLKEAMNKKTGEKFCVMPLYHPAAALYNPNMREVLEKDFKKIPRALKKMEDRPQESNFSSRGLFDLLSS